MASRPYLRVSGELREAMNNPSKQQVEVLSLLPLEVVQQIKEGQEKVWLSPNVCNVSYGQKQDCEKYPTPILWHARTALEMKYDLVAMDKATARSVRNRILKVTVGSDEYPAFDDGQVEAIAKMFNNPTRSLTLFWNHTLNIEFIEPQNTMLQDDAKYKMWNNEIRTAFGISEVMTGTSDKTGSIGNSMLNLKGVEEEVTEGQNDHLEFIQKEVDLLRKALGVKYEAKVSFDRMALRDEEKFMGLMMQFVQNGLLDPQTALETMRFNYPTILKRLEATLKLRKKGLFTPLPSANNMGPDGGIIGPKGGAPAKKPAGAPSGKKGKSPIKKAKAKLLSDATGLSGHLVLAVAELDAEDRQEVAELFGLPAEIVLTEAEYKSQTGKEVDWLSPLPQLSFAESMAAMNQAKEIGVFIGKHVEEMAAEIKAKAKTDLADKPKARGKYITEKQLKELAAEARAAALTQLRPEKVEQKEWDERVNRAVQDLQVNAATMGLGEDELPIYAGAMIARQYAKREDAQK